MNLLRALFSYPLLARELTERAARKRTYAVRVIYGLLLYTIFIVAVQRLVGRAEADPTGLGGLGFGRELFRTLLSLQCWAVLFLQPALMAGALTYEKERDSLSLLILTGMRPGKIILEKFLAGLLPMATLLLLALPLGAITMGYGGVSSQLIASGAAVVLAAWLMSGAWALLCSAWCRTTVGAMLLAYLGGAVVLLAPAIGYSLTQRYVLWGADLTGVDVPGALWALWPGEVFQRVLAWQEGAAALAAGGTGWAALLSETWRQCAPMVIASAVCLLLAMVVLTRRGLSTAPAGRTGEVTHGARGWLARGLWALGARVLAWWHRIWPPPPRLPTDDPIAWRESGAGQRGQFAYSSLLLIGITFALALFLMRIYPLTDGPMRLRYLAGVVGAVATLVLIVRSAGSLLNERTNQTLDILLTTALGADEVLREKARALRRYRLLFGALLGVIFLLAGWSNYEYRPTTMRWRELGQYCSCAGLAIALYPGLIIWVSLALALWLRARTKAILAALCLFAVWFLAPLVILDFADPEWRKPGPDHPSNRGLWLSLLSPLGILDANENDSLGRFSVEVNKSKFVEIGVGQPWVPVVCNFGGYLLLTVLVRWATLRLADRGLRR